LLSDDTTSCYIYSLSLHDALPILAFITIFRDNMVLLFVVRQTEFSLTMTDPNAQSSSGHVGQHHGVVLLNFYRSKIAFVFVRLVDRKSTRLNSSHVKISYAVFCLK